MARLSPALRLRLEKIGLAVALLVPVPLIVYDFFTKNLGANPVEEMTHRTGIWALRILIASLAVTPLRILFKWRRPQLFRRLLGLLAFAYACMHFAIYAVFDQELDFSTTLADVAKRPYITLGFAALVLMVPLAATSTTGMMKRLGQKRWRRLHQAAYLCAVLGVMHYLWLVKADHSRPAAYGVLLGGLLGVRVYERAKRRAAT